MRKRSRNGQWDGCGIVMSLNYTLKNDTQVIFLNHRIKKIIFKAHVRCTQVKTWKPILCKQRNNTDVSGPGTPWSSWLFDLNRQAFIPRTLLAHLVAGLEMTVQYLGTFRHTRKTPNHNRAKAGSPQTWPPWSPGSPGSQCCGQEKGKRWSLLALAAHSARQGGRLGLVKAHDSPISSFSQCVRHLIRMTNKPLRARAPSRASRSLWATSAGRKRREFS